MLSTISEPPARRPFLRRKKKAAEAKSAQARIHIDTHLRALSGEREVKTLLRLETQPLQIKTRSRPTEKQLRVSVTHQLIRPGTCSNISGGIPVHSHVDESDGPDTTKRHKDKTTTKEDEELAQTSKQTEKAQKQVHEHEHEQHQPKLQAPHMFVFSLTVLVA